MTQTINFRKGGQSPPLIIWGYTFCEKTFFEVFYGFMESDGQTVEGETDTVAETGFVPTSPGVYLVQSLGG